MTQMITLPFSNAQEISTSSTDCTPLFRIMLEAENIIGNSGADAITLDPLILARTKNSVDTLEKDVDALLVKMRSSAATVDANRIKQLLDYTDTVGSFLLLIGGVSLGFGAGPMLVAGIAFGGTMLVVRAVASNTTPLTEKQVLLNVTSKRIPGILKTFGEGTVVVSKNAASKLSAAGTVTGGVFTVYSFWNFLNSTKEFKSSTVAHGKLEDELKKMKVELSSLSDVLVEMESNQLMKDIRKACAKAVTNDLTAVAAKHCPVPVTRD